VTNDKLAARVALDKGEVRLTLTVPLGPVTIVAPAPALITRRNANHLGLTGDDLVRIVRAMALDPRFRDTVVRRGKTLRGAPPDQILAFLRSAPPVAGDEDGDALLRELGYEALPKPREKAAR